MDTNGQIQVAEGAVRRHFDDTSNQWCYSVVDVVGIVTQSSDPRNYWKVLKSRLKKAQNELVTQCNQLKMKASDGKFYLSDVANERTIMKIIGLVSPAYTPAFRKYFDSINDHNTVSVKLAKNTASSADITDESYPQLITENEEMMLAIDGYIKKDIIIIETFVAGASIENIIISVTCSTMTITGERTRQGLVQVVQDTNYSEQELYWGKFSRTIDLPADVEVNLVEATKYHGLLTIRLPLIDKTRTKIVKVKTTI